jgi:hypothetical protein
MPAIVLAGVAFFLIGCETVPTHYRWGIYEDHVYAGYANPGNMSPRDSADLLEADIAETLSNNQKVPPGVYAHLGYLRYLAGNVDAAKAHFDKEKQTFPESGVFIDTLLANLQGSNQ